MGQKVNPVGFRVGINRGWDSIWFAKKRNYGKLLIEDYKIRQYIKDNIVNVLINDRGKVLLDDQPTQIKDIKRKAIDRIKANDKVIFSVLTNKRTKYKSYIEVLDQLKQAGATKISIANPPN